MQVEGDTLLPAPRQTPVLQERAFLQAPPSGAGVVQPSPVKQQPPTPPDAVTDAFPAPQHGWGASATTAADGACPRLHPQQALQQAPDDMGRHQHALPAPGQPAGVAGFPQDTQPQSCVSGALPAGHSQHSGQLQPAPPAFQPSPASLSEPQHLRQQTQQEPWAQQRAATKVGAGAAGLSAVATAPGQPIAAVASLPAPDTMATVVPGSAPHFLTGTSGEHKLTGQLPVNVKAEPVVALLPSVSQATADPPSSPAAASADVIDLSQTPDSDQSAGLTGALSLTCTRCWSLNSQEQQFAVS